MNNHNNTSWRAGSIEVIVGSMFSGKTEELIRRLNRAKIAKQKVEIYKPMLDNRYSTDEVVSHDKNSILSTPVENSENILLLSSGVDVVGIDEAQFFSIGLVRVCNTLADRGVRVIVAGLDMDYQRKPFGPIPALLCVAEKITKLRAVCVDCGGQASFSYRISDNKETLLQGSVGLYKPLCRICYNNSK